MGLFKKRKPPTGKYVVHIEETATNLYWVWIHEKDKSPQRWQALARDLKHSRRAAERWARNRVEEWEHKGSHRSFEL